MKNIYLYKAKQLTTPIEDVTIVISGEMCQQTSIQNERLTADAQALTLYHALTQTLSGSVLDKLTLRLLERYRSDLVIRDKDRSWRQT